MLVTQCITAKSLGPKLLLHSASKQGAKLVMEVSHTHSQGQHKSTFLRKTLSQKKITAPGSRNKESRRGRAVWQSSGEVNGPAAAAGFMAATSQAAR